MLLGESCDQRFHLPDEPMQYTLVLTVVFITDVFGNELTYSLTFSLAALHKHLAIYI